MRVTRDSLNHDNKPVQSSSSDSKLRVTDLPEMLYNSAAPRYPPRKLDLPVSTQDFRTIYTSSLLDRSMKEPVAPRFPRIRATHARNCRSLADHSVTATTRSVSFLWNLFSLDAPITSSCRGEKDPSNLYINDSPGSISRSLVSMNSPCNRRRSKLSGTPPLGPARR